MRKPQPTTQTMTVSQVKSKLTSLIAEVAREETRILIERDGAPVAAIISAHDLEWFAQLKLEREERFSVIDRMRGAFKDVPPEEIEREADRSVTEARQRLRRRHSEPAIRSA